MTARRQCRVRTTVYGTTSWIPPPPVNTNTQVTYTGPTLRPCHLHHASDPAVSARTDALTGTIIQRCGGTRTRGTDLRVLCPSHARRPHGHAVRIGVPLGSALAWSACLLSMNSHMTTAAVMPTPKSTHTLRAQSRLVCVPNLNNHRTMGLRPCS